jgi:hypothetical protein
MMIRLFAVGAICLIVPLAGCENKSKSQRTETVTAPGGTTTTTDTHTVESSGQNPPASSTGEKAEK